MTANQLSDFVWAVGGSEGPHRTHASDCTQYLLWDGRDGILFDVGTGLGAQTMLAQATSVCGSVDRIRAGYLTHYHVDHAGGAAAVSALGIDIYGAPPTCAALREADAGAVELLRAKQAGLYPADYQLQQAERISPVPVDQVVQCGEFEIQAIATPGHCNGHTCYLVRMPDGTRSLFTGDCLFADGSISLQPLWDANPHHYADSVQRLATYQFDSLFPGHGPVALTGGAGIAAHAAASFAQLAIPPNRAAGRLPETAAAPTPLDQFVTAAQRRL